VSSLSKGTKLIAMDTARELLGGPTRKGRNKILCAIQRCMTAAHKIRPLNPEREQEV
jgi:hypothetical protein